MENNSYFDENHNLLDSEEEKNQKKNNFYIQTGTGILIMVGIILNINIRKHNFIINSFNPFINILI
jgi:hypothetical protein